HRLRGALDDLTLRLEDELAANVVRDRVALRPDDQLHDAGVVAQIDEDETPVVSACLRPPAEADTAAGVLRTPVAAHRVPPAHASSSLSSSTPSTTTSSSPERRTVQRSPSRTTVARACFWPYVIWPLGDRPAWSWSAEKPALRNSYAAASADWPSSTTTKTSSRGACASVPSRRSERMSRSMPAPCPRARAVGPR